MNIVLRCVSAIWVTGALVCLATAAPAADTAAIKAAIERGSKYLIEQGQADDGSF